MTQNTVSTRPFDPFVFWISAGVTIAFVLWSIVFPDNMAAVINGVFNWTTTVWAWLYLVTVFFLVMGCFVLMGPKYGSMKLGLPEDQPEFSNFSWFAMLLFLFSLGPERLVHLCHAYHCLGTRLFHPESAPEIFFRLLLCHR
ncbi:MAG: BCCT family transporter [Desulfobacteraceae bacterium]|nr:BCCT family transporter [Desulfobacteraceae bacterium]